MSFGVDLQRLRKSNERDRNGVDHSWELGGDEGDRKFGLKFILLLENIIYFLINENIIY